MKKLVLGMFVMSAGVVFAATPAQKAEHHKEHAEKACVKEGKTAGTPEFDTCVADKLAAHAKKK